VNIRPANPDDVAFLKKMLYEAARWNPDWPREPIEEVLADPILVRYHQGWGREGDGGVVAEVPAAPPAPDVSALRRERARATKAAAAHRATADRLGEKLRDARERVRGLEAEHAAALERALMSETERTRAERALAKAERRR